MATISSTGIGSGLDVNSIITQLMAVEARPLTLVQQQATTINTEISSVGQIQSLASTLGQKAGALQSLSLWGGTASSSSDATAVTADSSAGGATAASYSVTVDNLAQSQTATSAAFGSSASTLDAGQLTIQLGTWTGTPGSAFTPKTGANAVTIDIGSGDTALSSIRDKINAANAGVQASIITDANGARLSIRSTATGAENGFKISASETVDDLNAATGLSALAFDPLSSSSQMSLNQSAKNAKATVNGIPIESASNTLTNVSDGLNLTLLKASTGPVTINVTPDTASVKTAVTAFVTAFNALNNYIHDQTKYDPVAKSGGPLQGDPSIIGFQWQLRGIINQDSTASSVFARLSDVGISMQADGTLGTDGTKLDAALTNLPEMKKLMAATADTSAGQGFMTRFHTLIDASLTTDGQLDSRGSGLRTLLQRNTDQQAQMQTRLDATRVRISAQYQALDSTMAKMNALSSYVSQQMYYLSKA